MRQNVKEELKTPAGITISVSQGIVTVKGPKGEISKTMNYPRIDIKPEAEKISVGSMNATRREKTQVFSYLAHLRNMIKGVQEPYVYKVKICSGHFPMNVSLQGKELQVKNFLGEKVPRNVRVKDGVSVQVDGDMITIISCDKELAGQTAANFEQLTRITNRDRRIFQDGLYIIQKAGESVA